MEQRAISIGLILGCAGAILAHSRGLVFANGFTEPKLIAITIGTMLAAYYGANSGSGQSRNLKLAALFYLACFLPSVAFSMDAGLSILGWAGTYSGGLLTTALCLAGLLLSDRLDSEVERKAVEKAVFIFLKKLLL